MMLKSDTNIREEILRELRWEPGIGVVVNGGTVTLTGTVTGTTKTLQIHEAAQRVEGVFKIVNELKVDSPVHLQH